jgi:diguanylate cyclase (GGDEF)-like protein
MQTPKEIADRAIRKSKPVLGAGEKLPEKPRSFSYQIQERMASIERRDWELWTLALVMVAVLALGYFFVIFPAVFLDQHVFFIEARLSTPLVVGQLALVLLFLIYIAHKQFLIRSLRSQSIIDALNFELAHAQLMLDPLTHAFNRAALEEVISKEVSRAKRQQTILVFMYIDVDDLKQVNTRYGHLSGDLVLGEVGAILKGCVRGSDFVIRMGGDEFLVVLTDSKLMGSNAVKRRIIERSERWNQNTPLKGFQLGLSIGSEEFDGSRPLDEVLAEADAKMYAEKQARRSGAKS